MLDSNDGLLLEVMREIILAEMYEVATIIPTWIMRPTISFMKESPDAGCCEDSPLVLLKGFVILEEGPVGMEADGAWLFPSEE
jgi:hypothetical protein